MWLCNFRQCLGWREYSCVTCQYSRVRYHSCTFQKTHARVVTRLLVTHMNESCHTQGDGFIIEIRTGRTAYSMVTHLNNACQIWMNHEWVILHMSMSHITDMNASCHVQGDGLIIATFTGNLSYLTVTHMNESCHAYEWVMSHTGRRAHHSDSYWKHCLFNGCGRLTGMVRDMSRWYGSWHVSLICDMTHSHLWHDSLTWLIRICDMVYVYCPLIYDMAAGGSLVWFVTCLVDMPHSYLWYDLFVCLM